MHSCDTPACINIDHLSAGTRDDNMADMARKGRAVNMNMGKTVCKHGHPFTPENTYTRSDGSRKCRECGRKEARERMRRKRNGSTRPVVTTTLD